MISLKNGLVYLKKEDLIGAFGSEGILAILEVFVGFEAIDAVAETFHAEVEGTGGVLFALIGWGKNDFSFPVFDVEFVELEAVDLNGFGIDEEDGLGEGGFDGGSGAVDGIGAIVLAFFLFSHGDLGGDQIARMEEEDDVLFGGLGAVVFFLGQGERSQAEEQS